MKNFLIITLVLLGLIACNNSKQKIERTEIILDSIKILPKWGDNNVINLEMKKTKTIKRNGVSQTGSSTSNIELVISKNNNNSWNGKWSIKDFNSPSINNRIDKKIENLVNGFVYNFTIDSLGQIEELINWRDIQTKGYKTLDLIIEEIKNDPSMNPEIIEQIRMNVGEMFNSKEKIETYLMQEVQLYFALEGIEMTKSDTLGGITYISHPLTGDLIGQNIKTVYQKAYSDSTCDIQLIQTVNESDLYDAVKNSVDKVAGEDKLEEFQNEMDAVKFNVKIISDYNISIKTGLVEKVTAKKEITVGNDLRIDETEIIRK